MLLLLMMFASISAWAETIDGVKYVRYDTTAKVYVEETQDNVTVLTGSETSLGVENETTWYVVNSNISFSGTRIDLLGDVHLILANGCTMTAKPIKGSMHPLTVYGQSLDANTAGTLRISDNSSREIYSRDYTQHSGNVIVTGGTNNNSSCLEALNNVNIFGGKLESENKYTALTRKGAIYAVNDIQILGGSVSATIHYTQSWSYGILAGKGNITLGYTRSTDRITATNYYVDSSKYKISSTQTLKDNASTTTYTGTISASAIAGKTLVPSETVNNITYVMNSGTNSIVNPDTYMASSLRQCDISGTETTGLYIFDPVRANYHFDGWYLNENFTGDPLPRVTCASKDCSFLACNTGNQTLYAKWTFNGYYVATINNISGFYPYNNESPIAIDYTVADTRGTVLTKDIDYTAVIKNSADETVTSVIDRGTYTLTVTGIGAYAGTLSYAFTVGDWNIVNLSSMASNTNYVAQNGDVIVGTVEFSYSEKTNIKISIAAPAAGHLPTTVKLNNVIYDGYKGSNSAGITCLGDATIILEGTNVISGYDYYPAIQAGPAGTTLTIRGDGQLKAIRGSAGNWGAGIGGGYGIDCGNIRIESGTIWAENNAKAAGIGGGENSSCGTITITDGVTQVTAIAGVYAPYSIGAGQNGTCGTITIGGMQMENIAHNPYTYRPNVSYTIVFDKNAEDATGTMANQTLAYGEVQNLNANNFERWECSLKEWTTQSNGNGIRYADGASVCNLAEENGATLTLYAQWTENRYFVSYHPEGGQMNISLFSYTARSATFTLDKPTRTGYTFAGWTGTGLTGPTIDVIIDQGSTGNRSYYATWTPIVYNLNLPQSLAATVGGQPATTAQYGQTVTLAVASGYSLLEAPRVVDANAGTVAVTDNQDGTYSFTMPASNVTVTTLSVEPGWTFVGTYKTQNFDANDCYYYGYTGTAAGGKDIGEFVQVGGYVRVKPLRAYLVAPGGTPKLASARRTNNNDALPETMKVRLIGMDGETTEIISIDNGQLTIDNYPDAWYSLDGRKLQGEPTQKGVYINGGRKVVIK